MPNLDVPFLFLVSPKQELLKGVAVVREIYHLNVKGTKLQFTTN